MNRKLLVIFLLGLVVGILIGYVIPYLQPRKTIYGKLQEANIQFSRETWYEGDLKHAEYIQQIRNFESLERIFEEKQNPLYSEPTDVVEVCIDSSWNVLWIEVREGGTNSINYMGFYFYSEPD